MWLEAPILGLPLFWYVVLGISEIIFELITFNMLIFMSP